MVVCSLPLADLQGDVARAVRNHPWRGPNQAALLDAGTHECVCTSPVTGQTHQAVVHSRCILHQSIGKLLQLEYGLVLSVALFKRRPFELPSRHLRRVSLCRYFSSRVPRLCCLVSAREKNVIIDVGQPAFCVWPTVPWSNLPLDGPLGK